MFNQWQQFKTLLLLLLFAANVFGTFGLWPILSNAGRRQLGKKGMGRRGYGQGSVIAFATATATATATVAAFAVQTCGNFCGRTS